MLAASLFCSLFLFSQDEGWVTRCGTAEDPTLIRRPNGTIWLAYTAKRSSGGSEIRLITSGPDGKWSKRRAIAGDSRSGDYYPSLLQRADGGVGLAWFSTRSGNWDIWFKSASARDQWTKPIRISRDGAGDWAPSLTESKDGTLWLFWASTRNARKDLYFSSSKDGKEWSAPAPAAVNGKDNDDYPFLYPCRNGDVGLVWVRYTYHKDQKWNASYSDPTTEIYLARSKDGRKWTRPARLTKNKSVDVFPSAIAGHVFWTSNSHDQFGGIMSGRMRSNRVIDIKKVSGDTTRGYFPRAVTLPRRKLGLAWVVHVKKGTNIWFDIRAYR